MSAGGISFDCLTTSAKATLPSVEDWGTNLNILKDPTKSLYTQKKERVGDTLDILLAQEDSGDRIAECINLYPRGVNPMVGVSYNNYGSRQSSSTLSTNHGGTKLPYRAEVFRPPVLRQENLTPLSRQPRDWFYALTSLSAPNVIHKMADCSDKKAVRPSVTNTKVAAKKQYVLEYPQDTVEPVKEVKTNTSTVSMSMKKQSENIGNVSAFMKTVDPKPINTTHETLKLASKKYGHQYTDGIVNKQTNSYIDSNKTPVSMHSKISKNGTTENYQSHGKRREGQNPKPYSSIASLPYFRYETPQEKETTQKNINVTPLKGSVIVPKFKNNYTMTLNSDNIKVNPKICTDMQINPTKNVFKNPHSSSIMDNLPVHENPVSYSFAASKHFGSEKSPFEETESSSISIKENALHTEAATQKTSVAQQKWIGKLPEQKKRTVDVFNTETAQTKMKPPTSLYNIQSSEETLTKQGHFGSFDPKPQNVSRQQEGLDFSQSKQITSVNQNVSTLMNQRNKI